MKNTQPPYLIVCIVLTIWILSSTKSHACQGQLAEQLLNELLTDNTVPDTSKAFKQSMHTVNTAIGQVKRYMYYRDQVFAGKASDAELKCLLFQGYIAYTKKSSHLRDQFDADMLAIYELNPIRFWRLLAKFDFLLPASCYFLSGNFTLDQERISLNRFLETLIQDMTQHLNAEQINSCLLTIKTRQ